MATIAAVGYAAHGFGGGLLAAAVAFTPSFSFILLGGERFRRLRGNAGARAFLDGAGPAAIGAILGAADHAHAGAATRRGSSACSRRRRSRCSSLRQGVVATLLGAGAIGVVIALAGGPLP